MRTYIITALALVMFVASMVALSNPDNDHPVIPLVGLLIGGIGLLMIARAERNDINDDD